jgi:hypothetical protein
MLSPAISFCQREHAKYRRVCDEQLVQVHHLTFLFLLRPVIPAYIFTTGAARSTADSISKNSRSLNPKGLAIRAEGITSTRLL